MCSTGQIPFSPQTSDLLQEGGAGFQAHVYNSLVLPRLVYNAAGSWALRRHSGHFSLHGCVTAFIKP